MWLINPLVPTVVIWRQQNHAVFQALYLKATWESDMKIEGFLKEEDITSNVSKFGEGAYCKKWNLAWGLFETTTFYALYVLYNSDNKSILILFSKST